MRDWSGVVVVVTQPLNVRICVDLRELIVGNAFGDADHDTSLPETRITIVLAMLATAESLALGDSTCPTISGQE